MESILLDTTFDLPQAAIAILPSFVKRFRDLIGLRSITGNM
jgi:hypothetical protein